MVSYEEQTSLSSPASATPCGQVMNLTAVEASTGIQLTWNAPEDAVYFNIYRGRDPGQEEADPIASCADTTYIDTTAAQGVTYWYRVTAVDDYGDEGDPSSEASAAWVAQPTGALSNIPGSAGVLFTWLPQALVQTYNIYRDGYICTSSRGDFAFDLGMGGCNWNNPPEEGSTHLYTYTAVINGIESLPSFPPVLVPWPSNAIALHAEPQYNATTPGGQPQSGVALAWTPWGGDS